MEITDRKVQEAPSSDIGENQNGKADPFGNSGSQRGTGNTHIQAKNKDWVQNAVQNAAKTHTDHAESCTAL